MLDIGCDICEDGQKTPYISVNNHIIVRCNKCGLLYVDPQPTDEQVFSHYKDDRHWGGEGQMQTEKGSRLLYSQILSYIPPHSEVLDIGSSHGVMLDILKKSGHIPVGIELNEKAALFSLKQGYEVYQQPIGNYLQDDRFDSVVMANVVEHLNSPLNTLRQVWRVLKPGGSLLLATPNIGSVLPIINLYKVINKSGNLSSSFIANIGQICPPNHLYFFTPTSLVFLMKKAGFTNCHLMNAKPIINMSLLRTVTKFFTFSISQILYALTNGRLVNSYSILGFGTKNATHVG
jgi:2-polyprenyl-3-methyl-5-hydroxy-6-metoxy-1,4-benzoquinol methylase